MRPGVDTTVLTPGVNTVETPGPPWQVSLRQGQQGHFAATRLVATQSWPQFDAERQSRDQPHQIGPRLVAKTPKVAFATSVATSGEKKSRSIVLTPGVNTIQ